MADKNNVFFNLSYTHDEIEELLRRMASGKVLEEADYEKLIHDIGLDNISTFSGSFYDLDDAPFVAEAVGDLRNDMEYVTREQVNQKLDALLQNIVSMMNEKDNDNNSIFANQNELDIALNNLDYALRTYVDNKISALPLTSFATKTSLSFKADKEHTHPIEGITGLDRRINEVQVENERFALSSIEKIRAELEFDNRDVLQDITSEFVSNIDDFFGDDASEGEYYKFKERVDNRLTGDLSTVGLSQFWQELHEIAHEDDDNVMGGAIEKGLKFEAGRPCSITVGGIDDGTNLDGLTLHDIVKRMLYPDKKPEATASMVVSPTGSTFEIGTSTTIQRISVNVTKTTNDIALVALYANNALVDERTLGVAEGGTITFTLDRVITDTVPAGYYRIKVQDKAQYTVDINLPGINFYYPCYYGVVGESTTISNITEAQIEAMSKHVGAKGNKTFKYNTNNQRMVFAYPASYGNLTSILDANGFEQLKAFEKVNLPIVNQAGKTINYYVYMNNANTNSGFNMTYKF
jgi:hypothetical protein